jgi:sugar (pentulose or hexulose) kinase
MIVGIDIGTQSLKAVVTDDRLRPRGQASVALWAPIRADLTGLPAEVPRIVDTSPIAAAMLGAVAAGVQPSLAAAARLVAGEVRTVEPDALARAACEDAYRAYRELFASLRPMFGRR